MWTLAVPFWIAALCRTPGPAGKVAKSTAPAHYRKIAFSRFFIEKIDLSALARRLPCGRSIRQLHGRGQTVEYRPADGLDACLGARGALRGGAVPSARAARRAHLDRPRAP